MKNPTTEHMLIAFIFVFVLSSIAPADGIVVPRDPKVDLSVNYHRVDVTINNQAAKTVIDQEFQNPSGRRVQGRYIFPVPRGANISNFTMTVNGKTMEGEILSRDRARTIYRDIVRKRKDPAILEYTGQKAIRIRIFPIPANGTRRVKISYEQMLERDSGLVQYRYPLSTEKFSSKKLNEVAVNVSIQSPNSIQNVYSPSHTVDVHRTEETQKARVGYEGRNVRPRKDFLLYYATGGDDFEMNSLAYNDAGRDGFFSLQIAPNYETFSGNQTPKDVVFVMDTSGSMRTSDKLKQEKKAVEYCMNSLNEEDRFNIISFGTMPEPFRDGLLEVSKNTRKAAIDYIADQRPSGGTNVHDSLMKALEMNPDDSDRPFMIVFLTDGNPTSGQTVKPGEILSNVERKNQKNVRIFSVGIGDEVKTGLLDKLSARNGGERMYVSPRENLERKISSLYSKISNPVLSSVNLKIEGVETHDLYPKKIRDLFLGSQLILYGRYRDGGQATVTLTGRRAGTSVEKTYDVAFPKRQEKHEYLPRMWAGTKIGTLVDQIRLHGKQQELMDEVVRLSRKYGIVTPYTAYLIVEDENRIRRRPSSDLRSRVEQRKNEYEETAKSTMSGGAGRSAQQSSESIQKLKKQGKARTAEDVKTLVRTVGDRTFYRTGNTWYEESYRKNAEVEEVTFLGDRYFSLLEKHPELGRYFALGERVVVKWGNRYYKVVPASGNDQ